MEYRGLPLDRFQRDAVEAIARGQSVIVSAPTGTGKTLIADFLIEQILRDGGEVIYTSPIKALSNQKYRQYGALFGEENVGLVTGDLVINRDAPVRIMTTEILRNILLEGRQPLDDEAATGADAAGEEAEDGALVTTSSVRLGELHNLRAVIVDEIHFLADRDRGTVWEELMIYLPTGIQILGLSATLSNLDEFAGWLSAVRATPLEVIYEPRRAVPLSFSMVNSDSGMVAVDVFNRQYARWRQANGKSRRDRGGQGGRARTGETGRTRHMDVVGMLPKPAFPALYFIFSRALVERLAHELGGSKLALRLGDDGLRRQISPRLDAFQRANPGVLTPRLRKMYEHGVAFHHAGLHVSLKGLVEELYEAGMVRILYCTSTFALGINMPARTVIFDALTKFDGEAINPLTVREFMQMAGRAGRRGIDTEGDIIIRQDFTEYGEAQGLLRQLLEGHSEPVLSAFNLSFHAIVNLLDRFDDDRIQALLQRSFKAWQSQRYAETLRDEIATRAEALASPTPAQHLNPKQRERLRRHRIQLASQRRQLLEEERPRLWEEFQRKVEFLRVHGYLDARDQLLGPARIMRQLKIEEVLMTELVLNGLHERVQPEELYGIMCAFVNSLPRTARVKGPTPRWRELADEVFALTESDPVRQGAALMETEITFTPELMPLGERWARGESLAGIMRDVNNPTDLSGDMVGAFRRAKDLIGQLRTVFSEDTATRKALGKLLRQVTRDEVSAVD